MSWALAISVLMAFLGAGLSLFLAVVLYAQRRAGAAGRLVWMFVVGFGIWHAVSLAVGMRELAKGMALQQQQLWMLSGYAGLALGLVCGVRLWWMAWGTNQRLFLWVFGTALLGAVLPLPAAYSTIVPVFFLGWFLYWEQTFGIVLSHRSVIALIIGISAALYLFLIRGIAAYVEYRLQAVSVVVELALLFWAGILWLPLYAWISQLLSRRARQYAEFGREVIPRAGLILDFEKRMEFFARELCTRFQLRRVVLAVEGKMASAGQRAELPAAAQAALEALDTNTMYELGLPPGAARDALRATGCNYCFALRPGLLLLDTTPLASLDENEELVSGLAPQISQSLASCRLVEDKIALERELSRQQNLASLGKVAATIAHEVKNPLSAIKTIASVMREDPALAEQYGEDLSFLVSEADRLDASVRQMLKYARPAPLMEETVDLPAAVGSTVIALRRQAEAQGVRIESQLSPGVVLERSNRDLVQQIVLNLLLNAMEASKPGGIILVTVEPGARFAVEDQGPGIPAAIREKIFEPFFTTRPKGTGLGLSIVKRNAGLLGGEVEVGEGTGGKGAKVGVNFPLSSEPRPSGDASGSTRPV